MLRALIVDDEELARRGLEIRLADIDGIEICGHARNGREALEAVREMTPDLLFLDVQMPGMSGLDVLRRLSGSTMAEIIFVTAYDEFALKAFEANALDYLLKPINDERLREAVARARRHCDEKCADDQRDRLLRFVCELTGRQLSLEDALEAADQHGYPQRLAIRDGNETHCVDIETIDWIDAAGDYMCVHASERTYVLRGTMKYLEQILDPAMFVRVHRSAIVNCRRVTSMRPHRNGEYFLRLGEAAELKLSRTYKRNVERLARFIAP
jgi:two-component system LytT family response regulator